MKMEGKDIATLLELAIQSLLHNESAVINALGEIPKELFVPLFNAAFKGGHKKTMADMVKVWPFFCLHIGKLSVQEPHCELLKAMVDGLQVFPSQNSASRKSELRILDLRQDIDCRTTCVEMITKSPMCLHACTYSEQCILKVEAAQCSVTTSEFESLSSKQAIELLVDLSLDGTLRAREFISLIISKVEQSLGSLHLCCRDLHVDAMSDSKGILSFLDLKCIHHLAVGQASLSEVTTLLSKVVQLNSLSVSKITFSSLNEKIFTTFLTHLGQMDHLKKLTLTAFCLTNHLERLLRVLPPDLDYLHLSLCELSHRDFIFLAQCPQASHLKVLNLSNNPMYWEDFELFQALLENLSGTLQHLEINHCLLTDATFSVLLPALSRCAQLRVLSFASNPITMTMLMRIMQHLTPLKELKQVTYPIPVHCFDLWYFQGHVDLQKLGD
uniref:Melanoma antigen preferentially expressed in tumors-like n=1 Tax=Jaculus jaculus TaxID=51337 RepID=A0A8C5K0I2_JACJA